MRMILTVTATATALLVGLLPGNAAIAQGPWCAVQAVGEDTAVWNCRMRTFEECRLEIIAGNRGSCTQNPNWPGWYQNPVTGDAPARARRGR